LKRIVLQVMKYSSDRKVGTKSNLQKSYCQKRYYLKMQLQIKSLVGDDQLSYSNNCFRHKNDIYYFKWLNGIDSNLFRNYFIFWSANKNYSSYTELTCLSDYSTKFFSHMTIIVPLWFLQKTRYIHIQVCNICIAFWSELCVIILTIYILNIFIIWIVD